VAGPILFYDYDGMPPTENKINKCAECGISIRSTGAYCDVCQSMLLAVIRLPHFHNAHLEWAVENQRRIENKS
jgi:hypothetical protein